MSVTTPAGFRAAGVAAGLKASGNKDVALVVNDGPLQVAAAVFTTNRVEAAPVTWSRQAVADGRIRAVILNSGGANAATGARGLHDARATAEATAELMNCAPQDILVCSTGLIGEPLPMPRLLTGITSAYRELSIDGGSDAAEAIMTTDTVSKTAQITHPGGWSIGGIAKGAGMLAPGLATMLVVLTTDAVIATSQAAAALRHATALTFDRVDSDGCMSTNDTVALLASGASEISPDPQDFAQTLQQVCADLARQLVADAEGATHDIAVTVRGASSETAALAVARAVTRSNLVKTAIYGNDPNWGRIIAAVGTVPESVAPFQADNLDVWINGVQVCRQAGLGEDRSMVDLAAAREVRIDIDLHAGGAEPVTVWTNDLTHDYIHENSAYST